MTTTFLTLEQRLMEQMGDFLEFDTTTAITANVTVISTTLGSYDGGRDDYYNDWWLRYTEGTNSALYKRQVSDYASSSTLTVRGANQTAETAAITLRLCRHDPQLYKNAINDAVREIYPVLHKKLDVSELVTGNILPNSHFRDWASSAVPDKWVCSSAAPTATALASTSIYRGGGKSVKVTAGSAASGYMYLTSDTYPRLLDIMDKTVSVYAWASPEVANQASIVLYTVQASGSTQTLTSSTPNPIGEFSLLFLQDQEINDDLVEVQLRLVVAGSTKYSYFDHVRLIGRNVSEYLLPTDFAYGGVTNVQVQSGGYSARLCDDLMPTEWETLYGWDITDDGINKFLRINPDLDAEHLIRLIGDTPLSTLSADTDTVELDSATVNLLIAYAKYKLYTYIEPPVATQDIRRYETGSMKAYAEYQRLKSKLGMSHGSPTMNLGVLK